MACAGCGLLGTGQANALRLQAAPAECAESLQALAGEFLECVHISAPGQLNTCPVTAPHEELAGIRQCSQDSQIHARFDMRIGRIPDSSKRISQEQPALARFRNASMSWLLPLPFLPLLPLSLPLRFLLGCELPPGSAAVLTSPIRSLSSRSSARW